MNEMIKTIASMIIAILAMLLIHFGEAYSQGDSKESLIVLEQGASNKITDIIYFIEEQGGQVYHVFPPDIMQAKINDKIRNTLLAKGYARDITEKALQNSYDMREDLTRYMGAISWNSQFTPRSRSAFRQGGTIYDDLREDALILSRGASVERKKSGYMAGTCAVSVIFVECDGSREPQLNVWTREKKDNALAQIRNGLNWWSKEGGAKAHLTWVYEVKDAPIRYEPINHPMKEDSLWIKDAMRVVYGRYPQYTYYFQCRLYAEELREKLKSDWVFLIFVCENSNDTDGMFADGGFAYAQLGGPYMVLTYRNDGWEPDQLGRTAAHEVGHIFYALDEYAEAVQQPRMSGELRVENGNHELYGTTHAECMMKHNSYCLCNFTLGQIGWWDEDNDGRFDADKTWDHPPSTIKVSEPPAPPLLPIVALGSIAVETNPADASVYIDGLLRGQSPLVISELALEEYAMKVMKPGYDDHEERVRLSYAKSMVSSDITLKIADPIEALAGNLINANPDLPINVKIEKPEYLEGETLTIEFNTGADCYFYVMNITPDGEQEIIFPNEFTANNFVRANAVYSLPEKNSEYEIVVSPPAGRNRLIFLALKDRMDEYESRLADLSQVTDYFELLPKSSWSSRLVYFNIIQ